MTRTILTSLIAAGSLAFALPSSALAKGGKGDKTDNAGEDGGGVHHHHHHHHHHRHHHHHHHHRAVIVIK